MIAVIQRVTSAAITVDKKEISRIDRGLLVLLGVMANDTEADGNYLARKIVDFRIFSDANRKMNLSIKDIGGEVLVVSQFTLCANWLKGRRPSFVNAAKPEIGEKLYKHFINQITGYGISVKTGQFGAMMDITLVNDGPVTFVLDSTLKR